MRSSNEEAEPFPKRPERQLLYNDAAVEVDIWAAIGAAKKGGVPPQKLRVDPVARAASMS